MFYYDNSSRRYKRNITTLQDDFEKLLLARPVTYTRPADPDRWEIGFIAEEFDSLGLARLVDYDAEGRPDGINYEKICLYLNEVNKIQHSNIEKLQSDNTAMKTDLVALKEKVSKVDLLEKQLAAVLQTLESNTLKVDPACAEASAGRPVEAPRFVEISKEGHSMGQEKN